MASEKQLAANRANAQKSTGPKSEAGKARSRRNAIRDNFTGQVISLSDEERPIFEKLKAAHMAALAPANLLEEKLAHAIAWDTWRLDHLRAVEMNLYALGADESEDKARDNTQEDTTHADAQTFRKEAKRLELMSLYEQRMNRGVQRNTATLRELQAERKRNYERDKKEEIAIARLREFNGMPIRASAIPSQSGFLFSSEEIAVAAVRQRYLDTAAAVTKTVNPIKLYGDLYAGQGDSFFEKLADQNRSVTLEELNQSNSVSPELKALRRLIHPEEFLAPRH